VEVAGRNVTFIELPPQSITHCEAEPALNEHGGEVFPTVTLLPPIVTVAVNTSNIVAQYEIELYKVTDVPFATELPVEVLVLQQLYTVEKSIVAEQLLLLL